MARPKLPDDEKKKSRGFKTSDKNFEKMKQNAQEHKLSTNEYIEKSALKKI